MRPSDSEAKRAEALQARVAALEARSHNQPRTHSNSFVAPGVEPDGCGNCPGMTNGEPCPTVEVVAGQASKLDALLERAVF